MRSKMERLVILPFSAGCISEASVEVDIQQPRGSMPKSTSTRRSKEAEDDSESLSGGSANQSLEYDLLIPKSNLLTGFHRLFKGFKNFSQLFVDRKVLEEQLEKIDMEIGCPTDVQHVTHIGLDFSSPDILSADNHPMATTVRGLDQLLSAVDAHGHADQSKNE